MGKFLDNAEAGQAWVKKEGERLGKMASRKGTIAAKKLEEMRMKQNVSIMYFLVLISSTRY